ncbi:MAG: LD-carboxypeptidase, partial [Bacteroidota bacterium]|nr:LD-carboxypeptidase [Bacteroidota bacterium]
MFYVLPLSYNHGGYSRYLMLKAKALTSGDTIAFIAPASTPQTAEKISKSVRYFEQLGYTVLLGKHIERERGYLAGSDKERLDDLHKMIANKKVKAIFFIRGGYGTIRLLPFVDYDLVKRNPKIFVGYSDATALFSAIFKKTGLQSLFFGPMPGVDIWDGFDPFAEECMWRSITSNKPYGKLPAASGEIKLLGKARFEPVEGRMIGGTLTVFSSIMGTPFVPPLNDRILLFEDVGEEPYRIDRYFAQLQAAGALDSAKAILL